MNGKEFLSCGNIMLDAVQQPDGRLSEAQPGGPAFFALAGMRLYTDHCRLVCQAGADYETAYGPWLDRNGVSRDSVRVAAEHCSQHIIRHHADGTYSWHSRYGAELLGYLKTTPEQIDAAADASTRGIYLAQNTDRVFWERLRRVKERREFQIMWELESIDGEDGGEVLRRVLDVLPVADLWSLNAQEAAALFGVPREREEELIERIMRLPVALTLFRVGKRGAYAVTPTNAWFCRAVDITASVDPTGCGNCSTGAALVAHAMGHPPQEVVAMANIAAGYNAAQLGPWPVFAEEDRQHAKQLLPRLLGEAAGRRA